MYHMPRPVVRSSVQLLLPRPLWKGGLKEKMKIRWERLLIEQYVFHVMRLNGLASPPSWPALAFGQKSTIFTP